MHRKTTQLAATFTVMLLLTAFAEGQQPVEHLTALTVVERPAQEAAPEPTGFAALSAEEKLAAILPESEHKARRLDDAERWETIAGEARAVHVKQPNTEEGNRATKRELIAALRAEEKRGQLSDGLAAAAGDYASNTRARVRDRIEVKIALEQARLRRGKFKKDADRIRAHIAHARDMIRDFPDQPEGYGYMLGIAKGESADSARLLAQELLKSQAPERMKSDARRVLARLAMVGKPLVYSSATGPISKAKGRNLVVYTWTLHDEGFLRVIAGLGDEFPEVDFIGVYLDEDRLAGERLAVANNLPGIQVYDCGGLNGSGGTELNLLYNTSLYVADREGIVRHVDAHKDPWPLLQQVERGSKGGRP